MIHPVRIAEIFLRSGDVIAPLTNGVTVVVGGNNSGKTQLLKQVREESGRVPGVGLTAGPRVIESVRLVSNSDVTEVEAWLDAHRAKYTAPDAPVGWLRTDNSVTSPDHLRGTWNAFRSDPTSLMDSAPLFVRVLLPENALEVGSQSVMQRQSATDPPSHPLHVVEDRQDVRDALVSLSRKVFDETLTLDDTGMQFCLRLGVPSVAAPPRDAAIGPYRHAMSELPAVGDQGDGMRSFFGVALPLLTDQYPITLIDEPEAFLHPPQARALGEFIGKTTKETGSQVIVSTHDRDLLGGLLESGVQTSVVRLRRPRNSAPRAHRVADSDITALWTDPVLRFGSILDGLFHRAVVLTEADNDCRFYGAALDFAASEGRLAVPASDILLAPSHGAQGMAKLVRILRAADVPVCVSPDLDVLAQTSVLQELVDAFGGEWDAVSTDLGIALQGIGSSPERVLKTSGDRAFRGAQAHAAAGRVLDNLDALGIVLVREGELEAFDRGLAEKRHWTAEALRSGVFRTDAVQRHVDRLAQALSIATTNPEKSQPV